MKQQKRYNPESRDFRGVSGRIVGYANRNTREVLVRVLREKAAIKADLRPISWAHAAELISWDLSQY